MFGIPTPLLQIFPLNRGKVVTACSFGIGVARWSSDPIGITTVTFDGVNAGSEIRIYLPDGTEAAGVESCDSNHILTWSVYASGSANNTVRVVIVHPSYKIKEFSYVSRIGEQSIPVQQEIDKWFSNPA